jgi:hypothetical protein
MTIGNSDDCNYSTFITLLPRQGRIEMESDQVCASSCKRQPRSYTALLLCRKRRIYPHRKCSSGNSQRCHGLEVKPVPCDLAKGATLRARVGLAWYLSIRFKRPIVDRTGLTGAYDFKVMLLTDDPPRTLNDSDLPAVAKAIEELGLRLQAEKLPVTRIVIDHVEKPDAN